MILNTKECVVREEVLKSLINKLNNNKAGGLVHLRPLSSTVDFAIVWLEKPKPTQSNNYHDNRYKIYFIKNSENVYVGAVLDMGIDLHALVTTKNRRKGYLKSAMQETILPNLFQSGRKEQRITTQSGNKAAQSIISFLGFIHTGGDEYVLKNENFRKQKQISGQNTNFSKERLEGLGKELNYTANLLWMVQTEIEMKIGLTALSKELKDLVNKIKNNASDIEYKISKVSS